MSQKSSEETLILESNELTKQKERENFSKKTLLLKKSIQRVEDQGKRGKRRRKRRTARRKSRRTNKRCRGGTERKPRRRTNK